MGIVSFLTFEGEIVSETRNGVDTDYLNDPLGSVVGLINSSQTITAMQTYWPYGEVQSQSGGPWITNFGFCGGLGCRTDRWGGIDERARKFDPGTASWITVDPLWPEEQSYAYVAGNPITRVDPSGMQAGTVAEPPCAPPTEPSPRLPAPETPTRYPGPQSPAGYAGFFSDPTLQGIYAIFNSLLGQGPKPKPKRPNPRKECQDAYNNSKQDCDGASSPQSCSGGMSCHDRQNNANNAMQCASSRMAVILLCDFGPPDPGWDPGRTCGHEQAMCNAEMAACNCAQGCPGSTPTAAQCAMAKISCNRMGAACGNGPWWR